MGTRAWLASALLCGAAFGACTDFDNLSVPDAADAAADVRGGPPEAGDVASDARDATVDAGDTAPDQADATVDAGDGEAGAGDAGGCEVGPYVTVDPATGHCYKYVSGVSGGVRVGYGWQSAESDCVNNWHGFLVSITNPTEESFVTTFEAAERAAEGDAAGSGIWIGLYWDAGSYVWASSEPYGFNNFGNEDDAAGNRTCVWKYGSELNNHWADFMCDVPGDYVCERPP